MTSEFRTQPCICEVDLEWLLRSLRYRVSDWSLRRRWWAGTGTGSILDDHMASRCWCWDWPRQSDRRLDVVGRTGRKADPVEALSLQKWSMLASVTHAWLVQLQRWTFNTRTNQFLVAHAITSHYTWRRLLLFGKNEFRIWALLSSFCRMRCNRTKEVFYGPMSVQARSLLILPANSTVYSNRLLAFRRVQWIV